MKKLKCYVGMLVFCMVLSLTLVMKGQIAYAKTAGDYQLTVTTNRESSTCNYTIAGIDATSTNMEVLVTYKNAQGQTVNVLDQNISLNSENCVNGTYNGSFTQDQLNATGYENYTVYCIIDGVTVTGNQTCDFSLHSSDYQVKVEGEKYDCSRRLTWTATSGEQNIVPGTNAVAGVYVWKNGTKEADAKKVAEVPLTANTFSYDMNMAEVLKGNGTYQAKVMLQQGTKVASMGAVTFSAEATASKFYAKRTKALDKKGAFYIAIKDLRNPVEVKNVVFHIYDSNNKVIYTQKAKANKSLYEAEISLKSLNNTLGVFTAKAYIEDQAGYTSVYEKTIKINLSMEAKELVITKNKNTRTSSFRLKGLKVPGTIKQVYFIVYQKEDDSFVKKKKVPATKSGSGVYKAGYVNSATGKYKVEAYVLLTSKQTILAKSKQFTVKKSEAAKNGWVYEKYNGTTYKFYYKNNEKVTDLTKILGLQQSSASHTNNFYIEVNRAASRVTVYAYDSEKNAYIIPVRTFAVSVGRDTATQGTASSLTVDTSFTPLGDYAVSSNGTSVKYTMKPMYEPDGSTVYARWATHIVGNVYFHSIAVGSNSHYALSPTQFNRLGGPASAGCIRMMVADAKWIYDYVSTGTKVSIVKGNSSKPSPLGKAGTIRVSASIHYDPTDPEVPDSKKIADYKAGLISGYRTKAGKKVGYN
ncbi:MAG: L,D-transpeptidase [Lachnospiraceae bacterium]|nr:L,D-transpeptidase [Lachnospiraceae bacterium]